MTDRTIQYHAGNVPHSITLVSEFATLYVAPCSQQNNAIHGDTWHAKIQCVTRKMGSRLFGAVHAVQYFYYTRARAYNRRVTIRE